MKKALTILSLWISFAGFSQVNDFGIWTSLSAEYDFLERFSAHVSEELRFNENATELGSYFTDLGLDYKLPVPGLRAGMNYRYVRRRAWNDMYTGRSRWYMDLSYKRKLWKLTGIWRMRLQTQNKTGLTDEDQPTASNYLRNRFTFKYNSERRIRPFVYMEFFTNLNTGLGDNIRFCGGLEFKQNELSNFELFYLYQREYNLPDPGRNFVVGISYGLNLNTLFETAKSKPETDSAPAN
ncbi:MAG: hypothetical protein FD123_3859 [Bacteroidetes bacterium]|nr:MAG: hypothetical protein FD123_3859 [Bacteroidota bacterium]